MGGFFREKCLFRSGGSGGREYHPLAESLGEKEGEMPNRFFRTAFMVLVALFMITEVLAAQERGPSTREERERVLQMTRSSELDLLNGSSDLDRFWFIQFIASVPDITIRIGSVAMWCTESFLQTEREQAFILYHFMLSAVSAIINNPEISNDPEAVDTAGVEGVIRAYKNLLQADPGRRSSVFDEAVTSQEKGNLREFVKKLREKEK